MKIERIKFEMMSLWKESFGDSVQYINLIFDNYFNPNYIAFHEEDGEVVAGIIGIPFKFATMYETLTGLYLCGVSTRRQLRNKGIMSGLLKEINEKAQKEGFDFTFLIPAGEGVREYYKDRGYHDSFYKVKDRYVRNHNFGEYQGINVNLYNKEDKDKIIEFLLELQNNKPNRFIGNLLHTKHDWGIVLDEAEISNDPVYVAFDKGELKGIAFCRYLKESVPHSTIEVKKIFAEDFDVKRGLLDGIKKLNPHMEIDVLRDMEEVLSEGKSNQIWTPFYAKNNLPSSQYEEMSEVENPVDPAINAYPYGMVRIFDIKNTLRKTGITVDKNLDGFSNEELIKIVLRHPEEAQDELSLQNLLDLPYLYLSIALLLE